MKKFEYKLLEAPVKGFWGVTVDTEALTNTLNELGSKGWEVVVINDINKAGGNVKPVIILKREITH